MVSIILTTHNQKSFLSRAIDSVLNQTTMRWELLIIDDGSEDDTEAFIKKYFLLNKKIRYFKRAFNGVVSAKNFGIKNATGKYITFLNPEDELKPDHIQLRLDYLEEHSEIDLLTGTIDFEILKLENPDYYNKVIHSEKKEDLVSNSVLFGRRKVFELLNGFNDIEYYETDFIVRALDHFVIQKFEAPTYIVHLS
ncbi:MAG: glycosyltransferase [Ignavibacteria bacterium]|nr:glycosyltransferase [Ignavibacteria bacterium]